MINPATRICCIYQRMGTQHEVDGAVSDGLELEARCPCLFGTDDGKVLAYLEGDEGQGPLSRICDGWSKTVVGCNNKGELTDDAAILLDAMPTILALIDEIYSGVQIVALVRDQKASAE